MEKNIFFIVRKMSTISSPLVENGWRIDFHSFSWNWILVLNESCQVPCFLFLQQEQQQHENQVTAVATTSKRKTFYMFRFPSNWFIAVFQQKIDIQCTKRRDTQTHTHALDRKSDVLPAFSGWTMCVCCMCEWLNANSGKSICEPLIPNHLELMQSRHVVSIIFFLLSFFLPFVFVVLLRSFQ